MKIKSEELSRFKTDVIYKEGYRVVYYYENYHEVPEGLYAKNIEDFINFFKENNNDVQYTDINSLLKMFLKEVPNALGVAIYDVNQNCMGKIIKEGVKKINDTTVYKEELIYDKNFIEVNSGYRIVYLYEDNSYRLGMYAETLDEFMKEFTPYEPIDDPSIIPSFKSVEDLLNRYLIDCIDIDGVALYKVDGTLVEQKYRIKSNNKINTVLWQNCVFWCVYI